MAKLIAAEGHIIYKSLIRDSMRVAGYELKKNDPRAVLVWYDDLRKKDFYGQQKPWQIVNRFPMVNVICRKAPFVRLIQRTAQTFPSHFHFLPKSFLVPIQKEAFEAEVHKNEKRYIVKPDRGSLGEGIKIIEIGGTIPKIERLCVAQEYIPSFHIDDYKFDFRIYALVASVDPLKVYVYRDGVARFCSKKASEKSVFAELTNKSLNKKNPDMVITQIVKMIADVMARLEKDGHNVQRLWQRIDRAIVNTIITATNFMKNGMNKQCPRIGFQRCFQILGFDVLLDEDLNPYILEVNYRPSLETNAAYERKMKTAMLSDTMRIMAPAPELQEYVNKHYDENLEERWEELMVTDPELKAAINATVNKKIDNLGGYVQAFPPASESQLKKWERMITFVSKMPTELKTRHYLPQALKKKQGSVAESVSMTEIEDREEVERQIELEAMRREEERLRKEESTPKKTRPKSKSKRSSARSSKRVSARSSKRASGRNTPKRSPAVSADVSSDDEAEADFRPPMPEPVRRFANDEEQAPPEPEPAPRPSTPRKTGTKRGGKRRPDSARKR